MPRKRVSKEDMGLALLVYRTLLQYSQDDAMKFNRRMLRWISDPADRKKYKECVAGVDATQIIADEFKHSSEIESLERTWEEVYRLARERGLPIDY